MGKSFLKKNPKKGAMDVVAQTGMRSAGTVGGAFVANTVMPKVAAIKPAWRGPILFALGMAAEVFVENEAVNTVGQGVTAYGSLHMAGSVATMIKSDKSKLGLAGVEIVDVPHEEVSTPQRQIAGTSWADSLSGLTEELEDQLSGLEDDDDLNGLEDEDGDGVGSLAEQMY